MPNPYFNIMPNQVAGAAPPSAISVPQATLTFAGAPAAVTIVVKVLSVAFPALASNQQPLLVGLSLLVGLLIYWSTAPSGITTKDKVLGVEFALINSFAIAAATIGIDTAAVFIE